MASIPSVNIDRKVRLSELLLFLLALLFMGSCQDNSDGNADAERTKVVVDPGPALYVDAVWAEGDSAEAEITNINMWIYSTNGNLVKQYSYTDTLQLDTTKYDLPVGTYTVVLGINAKAPYVLSGTENKESLFIALDSADASPEHMYYGAALVTVGHGYVTHSKIFLRRVMAEVKIVIEETPSNTSLETTLKYVSNGLYPARFSSTGYGRSGNGASIITLPSTFTGDTIGTLSTSVRVMPTTFGNGMCHLLFKIVDAEGAVHNLVGQAPPMEPSGKYLIHMKYEDLHDFMIFKYVTLEDWTETCMIENPDSSGAEAMTAR